MEQLFTESFMESFHSNITYTFHGVTYWFNFWVCFCIVNPYKLKSHYSGFVIKFIIKIITHTCLAL